MPRFAANLTMMFNEVPFLDRFAAAARAGFDAVEFLFPYEYPIEVVQDRLRQAGQRAALFNMPPGDWAAGERGIAVFPERQAEFSANLTEALSYATALGVPRLHMMAGIAPSDDVFARTRYFAALGEAAEIAAAHGIDVLLEPLNTRDMPGYYLNSFDMAAEIISEVGRPNVKLQFDIYHCQILHGDVTTTLRKYLPITGHIQTASVPLRHEPCTGELDDSYLFRMIDELGYAGHIGCEYRPKADTMEGLRWFHSKGLGR
ncbi:2-oxo-tetronate isomerase [Devosia naphthalenivorans]|uniref:2-oxo-tetronate isomerase n=1 Tax=Devosia naphthalenivorans TaxID=2082392 RepID=UPI000D37BFF2|nr:2-oxo-tetronate isomerase [Devosia naphthalenivorans]